VGFLCQGWQPQAFVELSRLIVVAVYDAGKTEGVPTIRVAGYRPQITPTGVEWCSAKSVVLWKDLSLRPKPFAKTQRIDLRSRVLLQLALRLEHRIEQAERHLRRIERSTLQLPRLWAGYRRSTAQSVEASGPEIEALCSKFGLTRRAMAAKFQQEHDGLVLLPVSWVAEDLHRATTVFAETAGMARRQATPLSFLKSGIATSLTEPVMSRI